MLYLLLTTLLLINQFLTIPAFSQEPNTVSEQLRLEEYSCAAIDPASFKRCITEASQTGLPLIKIAAPIICESASDCTFEIKNFSQFLNISPSAPQNKFIRKNDFSYSLLTVENTSNLELKDLTFEDQSDRGCPQGTACPPLVVIKSSSLIMDKLNFSKTRGTSLSISDSKKVTLTSSVFKESFKTALEIIAPNITENIRIENNNFEDNAGSALVFQAVSTGNASAISSNTFFNNHSGGAYSSDCTYPCPGPQIKISGPTNNLNVEKNYISGGANKNFDYLGFYSSGVEFAGKDIQNTLLACNHIMFNRGSGIVQSGPFSNVNNLRVSRNQIFGNGLNLNIPTATIQNNNCYAKVCNLACQTP